MQCTNISDFLGSGCLGSRTQGARRFAIETMSFPAELCHI